MLVGEVGVYGAIVVCSMLVWLRLYGCSDREMTGRLQNFPCSSDASILGGFTNAELLIKMGKRGHVQPRDRYYRRQLPEVGCVVGS